MFVVLILKCGLKIFDLAKWAKTSIKYSIPLHHELLSQVNLFIFIFINMCKVHRIKDYNKFKQITLLELEYNNPFIYKLNNDPLTFLTVQKRFLAVKKKQKSINNLVLIRLLN